jgi:hypothetical protein
VRVDGGWYRKQGQRRRLSWEAVPGAGEGARRRRLCGGGPLTKFLPQPAILSPGARLPADVAVRRRRQCASSQGVRPPAGTHPGIPPGTAWRITSAWRGTRCIEEKGERVGVGGPAPGGRTAAGVEVAWSRARALGRRGVGDPGETGMARRIKPDLDDASQKRGGGGKPGVSRARRRHRGQTGIGGEWN